MRCRRRRRSILRLEQLLYYILYIRRARRRLMCVCVCVYTERAMNIYKGYILICILYVWKKKK